MTTSTWAYSEFAALFAAVRRAAEGHASAPPRAPLLLWLTGAAEGALMLPELAPLPPVAPLDSALALYPSVLVGLEVPFNRHDGPEEAIFMATNAVGRQQIRAMMRLDRTSGEIAGGLAWSREPAMPGCWESHDPMGQPTHEAVLVLSAAAAWAGSAPGFTTESVVAPCGATLFVIDVENKEVMR